MRQINFILVNRASTKNVTRTCYDRYMPKLKRYLIVNEEGLLHRELVSQLVFLRRSHPSARILGLEEIVDGFIVPSREMNALRKELSMLNDDDYY